MYSIAQGASNYRAQDGTSSVVSRRRVHAKSVVLTERGSRANECADMPREKAVKPKVLPCVKTASVASPSMNQSRMASSHGELRDVCRLEWMRQTLLSVSPSSCIFSFASC